MSNSYNYPYNQNNQGNIPADMSGAQRGTYMQNDRRMQQPNQPPMQTQRQAPAQMQTDLTMPSVRTTPARPSEVPTLPLTSLAGMVPTATQQITPLAGAMPRTLDGPQTPVTVASPYYTAGFLRNFIGKNVRVEFIVGTAGAVTDRVGTLLEVGASYIVIQPLLTDDLLMCDLYSIRFVTIFG
jgi:hypothetical protein